jgi:hypothetical protein
MPTSTNERQAGVFDCVNCDRVLDKIVELIRSNRVESAEMRSLDGRIGEIDLSGDVSRGM